MVTCSEKDKNSVDAKREPVLLIEVLSASTQREDTGKKLDAYYTITSLQAYIIIDPMEVWVRLHERVNGKWEMRPLYTELNSKLHIESLGLAITMADLYRFVL